MRIQSILFGLFLMVSASNAHATYAYSITAVKVTKAGAQVPFVGKEIGFITMTSGNDAFFVSHNSSKTGALAVKSHFYPYELCAKLDGPRYCARIENLNHDLTAKLIALDEQGHAARNPKYACQADLIPGQDSVGEMYSGQIEIVCQEL